MTAQTIVVTGAAGGIGAAVVRSLLLRRTAHGGARILATDRAWDPPQGTTGESGDDGLIDEAVDTGVLVRRTMDVTDGAAVAALLAEAVDDGALLRAVVHVAGVLCTGPAVDADPAEVSRVFEVNALGTIRVATEAVRTMLGQDATELGVNVRSLTTVSSNAATGPRSGFAAYGASKAAAASFTRSLGLEVGTAGIRCNVISPGTTRTPMVAGLWGGEDRSAATVAGDPSVYRTGIPLSRVADPRDVADVAEFLVSERARHITLADLAVDGGATQR